MKKTVLMLLMIFMIFTACHENKRESNPLNTGNGADDWVKTPNTEEKTDGLIKTDAAGINDNETLSPEASGKEDVFFGDLLAHGNITPQNIEKIYNGELSKENPDEEGLSRCMDYICKSLGIDEWTVRPPDKLEKKQLDLNGGNSYTVLELKSFSNLRLLIFKQNPDNTWKFIDFIDFGGRTAGTEYKLEELGNDTFVVGNSCRGYGTGEAIYSRDWYLVSDEGKRLVLSYPFEAYLLGHYGGYTISEKAMELLNGDDSKVSVDFNVSRIYSVELDISDEYGQIEFFDEKTAEFIWDDAKKEFSSEYPADEDGVTHIPAESPVFAQKCDEILAMYYDRILENIDVIQKDDGSMWKAQGIKGFLECCSDSSKKNEVLRKLERAFPELVG